MAIILNPTKIICDLNRVIVHDDGEAFGGSEPYIWPLFYKIDGENENITASIEINDSGISFKLNGTATVQSHKRSHGNLNFDGWDVSAPPQVRLSVPNRVGRFKSTLTPIPTTISIASDSVVAEVIDDVVLGLQELLDAVFGDRICPAPPGNPSEILGDVITEFITGTVGGLPGIFGGVYILMEEDLTSNNAAENGRKAVKKIFLQELTETIIPAISLDSLEPSKQMIKEIEKKITDSVTVVFVVDAVFWALVLGLGVGAAMLIDHDDQLGVLQGSMTHIEIATLVEKEVSLRFVAKDGNGEWEMVGKMGTDI
jgi:hypothetical protein